MPSDDNGWGNETKPRAGHSGRFGIDKIIKEVRRGDLRAVKRYLRQDPIAPACQERRAQPVVSVGSNARQSGQRRAVPVARGSRSQYPRADPGGDHGSPEALLYCATLSPDGTRPDVGKEPVPVLDIYSTCYLGDTERVQNLLKADPGLLTGEQEDDTVWRVTPLHFAVAGGHEQLTRWLIGEGALVKALYQAVVQYGRAPESSGPDTIAGRRGRRTGTWSKSWG